MPGITSFLSKNIAAYQIHGANTEVGKTIFSTLLARAAAPAQTHYLKPVSTGPDSEADVQHLLKYAPASNPHCLLQYSTPVSPHLAVVADDLKPPADAQIVQAVYHRLGELAGLKSTSGPRPLAIVESAGGVLSPGPSGSTQADLYRPLRLPAVLVGDSRLGGISSTLSAHESLTIRGYDTPMLMVLENSVYQNHDYFKTYFGSKMHVTSVPAPPEPSSNDRQNMEDYYQEVSQSPAMQHALEYLQDQHSLRLSNLASIKERANDTIWYPFSQHTTISPKTITAIDSAHGDFFQAANDEQSLESQFDASGSWWTQGLGHGNPELALEAAYAAGRYGHVILANTVHEPALDLAEKLLKVVNNPRLSRVFYSDNGSTGVEVALKMALKAVCGRHGWTTSSSEYQNVGVLGLKRSYHGDTIGTMDCCEPSVYNKQVNWYKERGFWFEYPIVKQSKGKWIVQDEQNIQEYQSLDEIFDLQNRQDTLKSYESQILEALKQELQTGKIFGALVIEPVLLGAGGMMAVDPLFQHALVNVVRSNPALFGPGSADTPDSWQGLPVVFDEVFTGLYRLGHATAASLIQVDPDISVHAKLLTGGVLPLCTTLASESIFNAFLSPQKVDGLLHGHSYTAHPVGCSVALASLSKFEDLASTASPWTTFKAASNNSRTWSMWNPDFVREISNSTQVDGVFTLGSVLAISLKDNLGTGYSSNASEDFKAFLAQHKHDNHFSMNIRGLGNVLYVMASQTSKPETIQAIESMMRKYFK